MDPRALLIDSFHAAVGAVRAEAVVPGHLPAPPKGRTLVVGAGKAAAAMAAVIEAHWPDSAPLDGLVLTRYGHGVPTRRVEVFEAGHPLPDAAGAEGARRILAALGALGEDDLVIVPISGGGSSLLSLPAEGLDTAMLAATGSALLKSGAPIQAINVVRKHLSRTLGGRLAAATRAPVLALIVSDVTGDEPTHIASGPFSPDPSTYADALGILSRWHVAVPEAVLQHLRAGSEGRLAETPKPGDACFRRVENRVVATSHQALEAAAAHFRAHGVTPVILGDTVTGEAREVAQAYAAMAREVRRHGQPWLAPVALISGGETTVTVRGQGRGGRNTEFLLGLALGLDGLEGVHALAADTDGIDGTEANAGAVIGPDTLARARAMNLDAADHLAVNDAYGYFEGLGDLLLTGPTQTNVNDYRVVLIG